MLHHFCWGCQTGAMMPQVLKLAVSTKPMAKQTVAMTAPLYFAVRKRPEAHFRRTPKKIPSRNPAVQPSTLHSVTKLTSAPLPKLSLCNFESS
jgi:hypothetical protein